MFPLSRPAMGCPTAEKSKGGGGVVGEGVRGYWRAGRPLLFGVCDFPKGLAGVEGSNSVNHNQLHVIDRGTLPMTTKSLPVAQKYMASICARCTIIQ